MTREEIIEGLKLLEDNMVYFDELLNDKGEYIDVHELLFESIEALEQEPCEDCIKIPEGATNEDMIKAMFPKAWRSNYIDSTNKFTLYIDDDHELEVDNDWWNSPYRKEQE